MPIISTLKLLLSICIFGCVSSIAQSSIKFDHITSENGLSQNDVNAIIQDDEGFMWFGTHDGLNKYDGYNFKVYRHEEDNPQSMTNNLIQCLQKDKDGNLWMINTNSGITKFDIRTETFTNFRHEKGEFTSAPKLINKAIYIDATNRLWVATNKGVSILNINKVEEGFLHYTILRKNSNRGIVTRAIFQSSDEQIWIGGEWGLFKAIINGKNDIKFINVTEDLGVDFVPRIHAFVEDQYNNLIVGAKKEGLFIKNKSENTFKKFAVLPVMGMQVDDNNNLWVGGFQGLHKFKYNNDENSFKLEERFAYNLTKPLGVNSNAIRALYKNRQGVLWAGTKGKGVNKFSPEKNPFVVVKKTLKKNSLSHNNVRSVFQDSFGTIWVGTEDGNLNYSLTNDYHDLTFNEIKRTQNVFSIHEYKIGDKKYLYLGQQSGRFLSRILLEKGKRYTFRDVEKVKKSKIGSVFNMETTQDGSLWIGTYSKGIFKYKPNKDGSVDVLNHNVWNSGLSNKIIRSILEDQKGNLWVGTAEGLNFIPKGDLNKKHPKIKVFRHISGDTTSISNDYILDVYQSNEGTIWIGTFGGGLNAFTGDPSVDKTFKRITTKDGLANNIIKGIEEDNEGNLWISSNKGITRYTIENGKTLSFGTKDGLQGEEFLELSSFKNSDGCLFFGGANGLSIFNPKEIIEKETKVSPLFTDFYLLNKKIETGEEKDGKVIFNEELSYSKSIVLQPEENSFSIEFSSTDYLAAKKNRFQFKLEGFDKNWREVDARQRFATYTNIPHGTYNFRLKTLNGAGDWSTVEKQLAIHVQTPWWKTSIAFFIYALVIGGLLLAFRRFTIVRAEEKHQYQVGKIEKKKSEELQQMKLEFFTNISHEFKTPLTLLIGPLDLLEKNNEDWNSDQRQKQYDLMRKNTNYLMRLVNQLLDFRKMDREKLALKFSNLNLEEFVNETVEPFTFLATKKNIDFKVISDHSQSIIPFDPDALEKILNNLLFNAFKFTSEGKSISLEIHDGSVFENPRILDKELKLKDFVVLQIRDTGKGISKEKLTHIFERYYSERDKNIQGAGIGLSFTKKLVEMHSGFIYVTSVENEGTTFSVLLPKHYHEISDSKILELENEVKAEQSISLELDTNSLASEIKEGLGKVKTNKKQSDLPKILLVEDNDDIRNFVRNGVLNTYKVIEASNGEEGLRLAKSEKPQLIISDIMMPVMDGFQMVKSLLDDEQVSNIPVIMLTAKSNKETEKEILELGVVDFVRKPFDLEVLLLKVKNIIEKQQKLRANYNNKVSLEPKEIEVISSDQRFLQQAMQIIEENMMNTEFSVETLVESMGMSRSNLYLKLKENTGLSSSEFIRSVRLKRAVQLLKKSDLSVKEIMYMTGFNTASYFSKCFKKQYGVVPSEYMKSLNKEKKH